MTFFETDTFQRPANYWLRRAERCKQSGDLIRAAVLERHAVRAEPDSDAARMSYAFTLRQLHCYEASNREAFAALAHNPDRTALFGLIGQNMFNLSMREAGIDAPLSHFSFCTNGSHFCGEAGIPTIGFGPSLESLAHVRDEYIEIEQLVRACRGFYGILSQLTCESE